MNGPDVKLIIVDDDQAFGTRLTKSFVSRGFACRYVTCLAELEKCIQEYSPTHAVVDLCLARESGLDVVSKLIEKCRSKTVVLTGYSSVPTALEAVRRGAVNYLSKPVGLDELLAALFGPALAPVGVFAPNPRAPSLDQVEWEHIQRVLRDCNGNITHAAKRLGLHRQALQRKLRHPPTI